MNRYMSLHATVCFIALSALLAPVASGDGFTLEQVMSAPFPSDLTVTRDGRRLAWVFDGAGKRNIWVADAPRYRGRPLTRNGKDDGQEIADLSFSPDGSSIAYQRGGSKNSAGEIPNPDSDPRGARQEVWKVNVLTGGLVKLGEGTTPFFSPHGERVVFSRENHLWIPAGAGHKEKKMFEIRGNVDAPSWSPDGSKLVFASVRYDHSFITVYDPKSSGLRAIQPSVDRDVEPRWSPDGKQIAFIRLINLPDNASADRERTVRWSIWVADASTGEAKEIWKSGNTAMDSFSRVFEDNVLQWAAGDRLVFGSEKDGWAHLYSIPAHGGEVVALTPGDYEVENVAWSPDRSFVVIATNAGDIDRRHLWRVNVTGGLPQAITRGESIEMSPVIVDGGKKVAFLRATAQEPLQPYVAALDGTSMVPLARQALPADFPAGQLINPDPVIFKAADGVPIHGQLFKPKGGAARSPAVIFMHGGPQRQMLLSWHYRYYYHNAYALNQYLASRGYMVLSVNYRSGIGYGRVFREAQHRGARGAAEYQDIVAGGQYLRARNDVDGARIGLWGGSYGGYLTAMGLARNSDLFAAGVDLHGVHDWSARVGRAPATAGSGELVRLARDSSPIASVDKWKSPVLLVHGDDDRNVAFSQTVELARRLRQQGVEFEQLIFPDEVHDFLLHRDWLKAYHAAVDFFARHLK